MRHLERHKGHRTGWLRAAVLGANHGIVSTPSLLPGVAATGASLKAILVTGVASLVVGAMSMAAGEYVSVSSQTDTENADLARERSELANQPDHEHAELAAIYVQRGLNEDLAKQIATQLMGHDALGAHARDELGLSDTLAAKPVQAALASATTFAIGALLPLLVTLLLPANMLMWGVAGSALFFLAALGALAAHVGGSSIHMGLLCALPFGVCAGHGANGGCGHLVWRANLVRITLQDHFAIIKKA